MRLQHNTDVETATWGLLVLPRWSDRATGRLLGGSDDLLSPRGGQESKHGGGGPSGLMSLRVLFGGAGQEWGTSRPKWGGLAIAYDTGTRSSRSNNENRLMPHLEVHGGA